MNRAAAE